MLWGEFLIAFSKLREYIMAVSLENIAAVLNAFKEME